MVRRLTRARRFPSGERRSEFCAVLSPTYREVSRSDRTRQAGCPRNWKFQPDSTRCHFETTLETVRQTPKSCRTLVTIGIAEPESLPAKRIERLRDELSLRVVEQISGREFAGSIGGRAPDDFLFRRARRNRFHYFLAAAGVVHRHDTKSVSHQAGTKAS